MNKKKEAINSNQFTVFVRKCYYRLVFGGGSSKRAIFSKVNKTKYGHHHNRAVLNTVPPTLSGIIINETGATPTAADGWDHWCHVVIVTFILRNLIKIVPENTCICIPR